MIETIAKKRRNNESIILDGGVIAAVFVA